MSVNRKLQCPDCGSHNTQAVEVAYSQSVRTGYNGYQTISAYGETLSPPEPRSVFLVPLGVAAWVWVLIAVVLPAITNQAIPHMSDTFLPLAKGPVIAGLGTGIVFGLMTIVSAVAHNRSAFEADLDDWLNEAICKRCGHRF